MLVLLWVVSVVVVLQECDGFHALSSINKWRTTLQLSLSNNDHQPESMREREISPLQRQFQSLPWLTAMVVGVTTFRPKAAFAGKQDEANAKLASYGLPPILFVPPGFTPLVSEFGRGNIREAMTNPIIVQFSHPGLWIESLTTVNTNGEAGTVSANDYIKGDSAFFYNQPLKAGDSLNEGSKELVGNFIKKSLSQKWLYLWNYCKFFSSENFVGILGIRIPCLDASQTLIWPEGAENFIPKKGTQNGSTGPVMSTWYLKG